MSIQPALDAQLRLERSALLIGQLFGQLSELLNCLKNTPMTTQMIYNSLKDITDVGALTVHAIYWKDNKQENVSTDSDLSSNKFKDILDKKLYELDWDINAPEVRIISCLRQENIHTVKDVLQRSKNILRKIPNFGKKCIVYLEETLNKLGFEMTEGMFSDSYNTLYAIKTTNGETLDENGNIR